MNVSNCRSVLVAIFTLAVVFPTDPAFRAVAQAVPVYKAGDRVLTSINSSIGDYQPCTIMGLTISLVNMATSHVYKEHEG